MNGFTPDVNLKMLPGKYEKLSPHEYFGTYTYSTVIYNMK